MDELKYQDLLEKITEVSRQNAKIICRETQKLLINEDLNMYFEKDLPKHVLKGTFGYDEFLPLQEKVINSILSGKDTIAIMPTGGGKSLCYQIPGLIFEGMTIVVSPLIALMQDQISVLKKLKVKAEYLSSSMSSSEYLKAYRNVLKGKVKILYLSPEALNSQRIYTLIRSSDVHLDCIAIDEAHCISEWGNDFRPDYLEIANFRKEFPEAVCLALTATATKTVQNDISRKLKMKNPDIFVTSFNRPNLYIEVRNKIEPFEQILSYIQSHKGESGIIYCSSRKKVDDLTEKLNKSKIKALSYHAGLDDKTRTQNQEDFLHDKVQIMVATIAFGMGINKSNIRFVIHYDIPKSLEQYYQEIGRAGRDGKKASALLLFNQRDITIRRKLLESEYNATKALNLFSHMINFCLTEGCRRKLLLNYFGENQLLYQNRNCCCDNCKNKNALNHTYNSAVKYNSRHVDDLYKFSS